jgi:hypothetical protein
MWEAGLVVCVGVLCWLSYCFGLWRGAGLALKVLREGEAGER